MTAYGIGVWITFVSSFFLLLKPNIKTDDMKRETYETPSIVEVWLTASGVLCESMSARTEAYDYLEEQPW